MEITPEKRQRFNELFLSFDWSPDPLQSLQDMGAGENLLRKVYKKMKRAQKSQLEAQQARVQQRLQNMEVTL